jgi:hypothetical protein
MNHVKEAVKKYGITHFVTYADNYAVGYFQKQVGGTACGSCVLVGRWLLPWSTLRRVRPAPASWGWGLDCGGAGVGGCRWGLCVGGEGVYAAG